LGKGVLEAVNNVRTLIAPNLLGMDVRDQEAIDRKLNGLMNSLRGKNRLEAIGQRQENKR